MWCEEVLLTRSAARGAGGRTSGRPQLGLEPLPDAFAVEAVAAGQRRHMEKISIDQADGAGDGISAVGVDGAVLFHEDGPRYEYPGERHRVVEGPGLAVLQLRDDDELALDGHRYLVVVVVGHGHGHIGWVRPRSRGRYIERARLDDSEIRGRWREGGAD